MATQFQSSGLNMDTTSVSKQDKPRKPGLVLLFGIITLGIYFWVWHFKFQDQIREETGKGILPTGHLIMFLFPVVNLVYYVFWLCVIDGRVSLAGAPGKNRWWLMLLLFITVVGNLFIPTILQAKANKIGSEDTTKIQTTQLRVDRYAKYR